MPVMRHIQSFALAAFTVLTATTANAASPWSASWQLDKVKSAPAGASFIIAKNPDGSYQMQQPGQNYKFKCDGGDYTIKGTFSVGCKESGREMDIFYKDEGAQTARAHRVLSADGKTLTVDTVNHSMPTLAPNNSTTAHGLQDSALKTQTYDRLGAGEGFVGAWKENFANDGTGPILETTLKGSTFEVNYTDRKQDTTMPLSGKDVPLKGTFTISVQATDPHAMKITIKNNGSPVIEETLTMSDDTRTLTDESWKSGHPEQKQRKIYTRL